MRMLSLLFMVVLLIMVHPKDILRRLYAPIVGGQTMILLLASKLLVVQNGGIMDVEINRAPKEEKVLLVLEKVILVLIMLLNLEHHHFLSHLF